MRVIVIICLLAGVAEAQPARELYEQGLRHYDAGEYDEAIAAWQESFQLSGAPLLLFNIGQAYRLDGDCVTANQFYARYREAEPQPRNLEELVAAEARCEGATAEQPPPEEPPPVIEQPPPAVVTAPIVETAVPAPPRSRRGQRSAGLATGGAGLVLAGTGVYFGMRAADAAATIEDRDGEWTAELAELEARGQLDRTIGWITGAAGAAAIVTGGVLYLLGRDDPAVEVSRTRGGAAVSWRVRF